MPETITTIPEAVMTITEGNNIRRKILRTNDDG